MRLDNLTKEELEALEKVIEPMQVNILKMKVGDVIKCITNEKSFTEYVDSLDYTILEKFAFVKGFINQINGVFKSLDDYNDNVPPEYQSVLMTTKGLSTPESIIVDCIKYYHLNSTEQAENLPFFDWYIMKRDDVISASIQRKYDKMMLDKQQREAQKHR